LPISGSTRLTGIPDFTPSIEGKHAALERRVQLMHDGTLEKDMLDEQARKNLNLAQSDEIIIMRGRKN
jgi:cell division protein FtsB